MTEIERSVSLGTLNRIDFRELPVDGQARDGAVLTRHLDEFNDKAFLTPEARKALRRLDSSKEVRKFLSANRKLEKPLLEAMQDDMIRGEIDVDFNLTVAEGPLSPRNARKRAWRARIMEKNHYGLVNVRTDGQTILCATMNETGEHWITHTFPARFQPPPDEEH